MKLKKLLMTLVAVGVLCSTVIPAALQANEEEPTLNDYTETEETEELEGKLSEAKQSEVEIEEEPKLEVEVVEEENLPENSGVVFVIPYSSGYQSSKNDSNMLAYYMDEPLYDAIYNKYKTVIDIAPFDGEISVLEANNYTGVLDLNGERVTGSIRGIEKFTHVSRLDISNNYFTGDVTPLSSMTQLHNLFISSNYFTGNMSSLSTLVNLDRFSGEWLTSMDNQTLDFVTSWSHVNYLSVVGSNIVGTLNPVSNLASLQILRLGHNKITGSIPSSWYTINSLTSVDLMYNDLTNLPDGIEGMTNLTALLLHGNPNLTGTLPDSIADIASYHDTKLNAKSSERPSTNVKYSIVTPQDGEAMKINSPSGIGANYTLNIQRIGFSNIPQYNIDVNGDGIVDLNLDIDGDGKVDFNNSKVVTDTSGNILGWIPIDKKFSGPVTASDVTLDPDTLWLTGPTLVDDSTTMLELVCKLELNKDNGDGTFSNIDIDYDGFPDINVSGFRNNENKNPAIDLDENGYPIQEKPSTGIISAGQTTDPTAPNYITPDGEVNNWDKDGDGKADYNKDANGDGVADFDVIVDNGDGTTSIWNPVQTIDPDGLNFDEDGDGIPDKNIDLDGDGIADLANALEKINDLFKPDGVTIKDTTDQSKIDAVQDIVDKMLEGAEKNKAQTKLDDAQNQLNEKNDAVNKVNDLFTDSSHTDIRNTTTQGKIDEAQTVVNKLPSGELKDELQKEVDKAQNMLNAKKKVDELFNSDGTGKIKDELTLEEINDAQDLVNKLPNGSLKDKLQDLIDNAKDQWEELNDANDSTNNSIDTSTSLTKKPSISGGDLSSGSTVSTGDTTSLVGLCTLLGLSLFGMLIMVRRKKAE